MPQKELKVYPVKIDKKRLGEIDCGILPKIPHLILAVGSVKAGKTTLYNSLYLNPDFYGDKFQVRILLSPTAHQDEVNRHLVQLFDYVIDEVDENIINELLDMIKRDKSDNKYLMLFDDVVGSLPMNKNGKPDILSQLATKYRHVGSEEGGEGKLSIFIATQYFNFLTPIIRNNASGYFFCGNASQKEVKSISENLSVFGGSEKAFVDIYKKAKKEPFDILYLNMEQLKAHRNFGEVLFKPEDLQK
tara:strand:+ start:440 stop:1177 length:738 start_codon:yes stop_codon:yes gene_type:complete